MTAMIRPGAFVCCRFLVAYNNFPGEIKENVKGTLTSHSDHPVTVICKDRLSCNQELWKKAKEMRKSEESKTGQTCHSSGRDPALPLNSGMANVTYKVDGKFVFKRKNSSSPRDPDETYEIEKKFSSFPFCRPGKEELWVKAALRCIEKNKEMGPRSKLESCVKKGSI